ncbi:PREDICTED: uncharacterized protein LOC105313374 [Amphimedon queenslandica]|uniref:Ras-associating domain-containing protein n=1 Tax=Amphimedon queenslandica TaxID=400682 RepID=A0A1X7UGU4_AMPQE|nr:PREDICTED: uncharacterized protein LOC105313374 [Amphimedon queenslandica]|eukprot:XP_011405052.1 PREDICTED: uncharacterized protein LOC105313374 [Amphimedon queenslandica]
MFFIVYFGANEEEIFNPECPVRILLEDVKNRCNCTDKDSIGFLDDKRVLVNIADEKSMENAAKYFTDRGVYTLLAIERRGDATTYVPLVDEPSKELLVKIESLQSVGSKNPKSQRRGSRTPQSMMKPPNQMSASKGRQRKWPPS